MKSIQLLLVEDNEGDVILTLEALEDAKINNNVAVARDGQEAIDYLSNNAQDKSSLPDLVLLDVNLPKKNGHEVLAFMKNNPDTKHIPVIMLTTSSAQKDIDQAYENYVNCYITKPVDVDTFFKVIAQIQGFWFDIVKLAPKD